MSEICHSTFRAGLVLAALFAAQACAQEHPASNSDYALVENWAQLPDGFEWGQVISVEIDADGNLIAFQRCSSDTCVGSSAPPLLKFSPTGEHLMSWGENMMVWPHGLYIDADGNIWVTDGRHEGDMGEVIHKFSADGELLMTIGTPGVAGNGAYTFNGISDIVVADNGDLFVVDGHFNNRVAKHSSDGTYLMSWGQPGDGPGEFDQPHSIAIDSQGRVFVA
ncbi:MAG TPA: 6-bladed beta-propeller, partial [Gammaproteobacteria bacterium]